MNAIKQWRKPPVGGKSFVWIVEREYKIHPGRWEVVCQKDTKKEAKALCLDLDLIADLCNHRVTKFMREKKK